MKLESKNNAIDLERLLYKILEKLEIAGDSSPKKYYRNKDLKHNFGLAPNTIIKYREEGILPFTILGEIYLYPVKEVDYKLKKYANY